jgi:hypothetical protein
MPRRHDGHAAMFGRQSELAVLDGLVAGARAGQSQVLVLRGEAGIGKTALLEYLETRAVGCHIVRLAGVEAEMELAYAGLHQLCAPFLDRLNRLPDPQRSALGTAFGLTGGEAPDRFLVGLAVLDLLADRAEQRPLICLIDDAQWLDRVSAQTVAFVARRLLAERIVLLVAMREQGDLVDFAGLPELMIKGLIEADAGRLLDSVIKGPVDLRVRDRIIAETRGNPLALLELPRAPLRRRSSPKGSSNRTWSRWRVASRRALSVGYRRSRTRPGACSLPRRPNPSATQPCCGGRPLCSGWAQIPRTRPRRRN